MPKFTIRNGPFIYGTHDISDDMVTVGRSSENSICIPENSVSRHHFQIQTTHDGFFLHDSGSSNGTFINGRQITFAPLNNGDIITIGNFQIVFESEPPNKPITPAQQYKHILEKNDYDDESELFYRDIAVDSMYRKWKQSSSEKIFAWGKVLTVFQVMIAEKRELKQQVMHSAHDHPDKRSQRETRYTKMRRLISHLSLLLRFDEQRILFDYVTATPLPPKMKDGFASLFKERLAPIRSEVNTLIAWLECDHPIKEIITKCDHLGKEIQNELERTWREKHNLLTNELHRYRRDNKTLENEIAALHKKLKHNKTDEPEIRRDIKRKESIVRSQRRRIREYQYYLDNLGNDPRHAITLMRREQETMRDVTSHHRTGTGAEKSTSAEDILEALLNRQIGRIQEDTTIIPHDLSTTWGPQLFQSIYGTHNEFYDYFKVITADITNESSSEKTFRFFLLQSISHPELVDYLDSDESTKTMLQEKVEKYQSLMNRSADCFFQEIHELIQCGGSPIAELFRDFFREAVFCDLQLLSCPELTDLLIKIADGNEMVSRLRAMCAENDPATAMLFAAFFTMTDMSDIAFFGSRPYLIDMEVPLRKQLVRLCQIENRDKVRYLKQNLAKGLEHLDILPNLIEIKAMQATIIRERGIDRTARRLSHRLEGELMKTIRLENKWRCWKYPQQFHHTIELKLRHALKEIPPESDPGSPDFWSVYAQGFQTDSRWPNEHQAAAIVNEVKQEAVSGSDDFRKLLYEKHQPSPFDIFDLPTFLHDIAVVNNKRKFLHFIRLQFTDIVRLQEVDDMVSAANLFLNSNEFTTSLKTINDNLASLQTAMKQEDTIFEPHIILEEIENLVKEVNGIIEDFNTNIAFFNDKLREEEQFLPLVPLDEEPITRVREILDGVWCTRILSHIWSEKDTVNEALLQIVVALSIVREPSWELLASDITLRRLSLPADSPLKKLGKTPSHNVLRSIDGVSDAYIDHFSGILDGLSASELEPFKLLLFFHLCVLHPELTDALSSSKKNSDTIITKTRKYQGLMTRCGRLFIDIMLQLMKGDVFRFRDFLLDIFSSMDCIMRHKDLVHVRERLQTVQTTNHSMAIQGLESIFQEIAKTPTMGKVMIVILTILSYRFGIFSRESGELLPAFSVEKAVN